MYSNSKLKRNNDGETFKVILLAQWSTIRSENGEEDYVKWYGDDKYVSTKNGFTYTVLPNSEI